MFTIKKGKGLGKEMGQGSLGCLPGGKFDRKAQIQGWAIVQSSHPVRRASKHCILVSVTTC